MEMVVWARVLFHYHSVHSKKCNGFMRVAEETLGSKGGVGERGDCFNEGMAVLMG